MVVAPGSSVYSNTNLDQHTTEPFLIGATPKYARNHGHRLDGAHHNTLARLFVRLDPSEKELFFASIGDEFTRTHAARRLAGVFTDVRPAPQGHRSAATTGRETPDPVTNGYLDFLITNVQMGVQEKVQVSETLADNYVAYFFGQSAPQWQYSGMLINSVQDDQATNFLRLYAHILRGTQMARRQKVASLKYDSYIVVGVMTNLQLSLKSDNELLIPFGFTFLVKKILITNYTSDWRPTSAEGVFATDFHAVPFDGRPIEESQQLFANVQTPPGTVQVPVASETEDPRVSLPPPTVGGGAIPASGLSVSASGTNLPVSGGQNYGAVAANYSDRPETVNTSGTITPAQAASGGNLISPTTTNATGAGSQLSPETGTTASSDAAASQIASARSVNRTSGLSSNPDVRPSRPVASDLADEESTSSVAADTGQF